MKRLLEKRSIGSALRILLFTLLLVVPLVLIVLNQRREAVSTGLWYVVWLGTLIYKSVPQGAYWILFLLVALVVAAASLVRRVRREQGVSSTELARPGRVQHLSRLVRGADQSSYVRWQLARLLGDLTREVIARQGPGAASGELEPILAEGSDLPPELRAYLEAGLDRWPHQRSSLRGWVRRLLRISTPIGALDLDPERVVEFLEAQGSHMEVFREH